MVCYGHRMTEHELLADLEQDFRREDYPREMLVDEVASGREALFNLRAWADWAERELTDLRLEVARLRAAAAEVGPDEGPADGVTLARVAGLAKALTTSREEGRRECAAAVIDLLLHPPGSVGEGSPLWTTTSEGQALAAALASDGEEPTGALAWSGPLDDQGSGTAEPVPASKCSWGAKCQDGWLEPDDGCGFEPCPECNPEPTPPGGQSDEPRHWSDEDRAHATCPECIDGRGFVVRHDGEMSYTDACGTCTGGTPEKGGPTKPMVELEEYGYGPNVLQPKGGPST